MPSDFAALGCIGVESALDHIERLRKLALHDSTFLSECAGGSETDRRLDPKTLALVRLAALVGVGGAVASYGVQADAAISAGATVDEIVDVLTSVVPVVGFPRAVAAAPKLSLALGHDPDEAFEP